MNWFISGGEQSRVKAHSSSSRGGKTVVRIELEVADGYELADILRQIHDAQAAAAKPTRTRERNA